ncbi:hypothetical protein HX005_19540, partial [Acinetobacter sp. R933-2]|nr:hypothetical protein [Acinetobacter sp. R933-2]
NSNGSWTKFADGTMICRIRKSVTLPISIAAGGGFKSEDIIWVYPMAFIAQPQISTTSCDSSSFSIRVTAAGASSTSIHSTSLTSIASASISFDIVATGRWFS